MRVVFETDDNVSYDLKEDFGFICDFPEDMSAPAVRTNYVTIPGRNGELDLTEIDGNLYYEQLDFTIVAQKICRTSVQVFSAVREFINLFNGQRIKVILDNDEYYYDARVNISTYSKTGLVLFINIDVNAYPFRLQHEPTVINVTLTGTEQTVNLENGTMQVVPNIMASAPMSITYGNTTWAITAGTNIQIPSFILTKGDNEVSITGTGTISFTYTKGEF